MAILGLPIISTLLAQAYYGTQDYPAAKPDQQCLTILHFNDLHGHIERAPQMASVIKYFEKENEKYGCSTIVLNSGDLMSGTYVSDKFKGEAEFNFLKAIGTDAMVVGNHDFDFGVDALKKDIGIAPNMPVLGANIYLQCEKNKDNPTCPTFATPYIIIPIASLKIAIFGIAHENTAGMSFPDNVKGVEFADGLKTAQALMKKLVGESDVQIALTHEGVEKDLQLARKVPGVDVVVGGHDHVRKEAYCKDVSGIPVCQTPPNGDYLGRIDLLISGGRIVRSAQKLIPIDDTIQNPDPDVAGILGPYVISADQEANVVVGNRANPTDKMKLLFETIDNMREKTGVDIAFLNGSGIRGGLPAGNITFGAIFETCPFNNNILVGEMKGKDIRAMIKGSAESMASTGRGGLYYSGLKFDRKTDPEFKQVMINGKLLEDDVTYSAATVDFLAYGGSNHEDLKTSFKIKKNMGLLRNLIVAFLRNS